MQHAFKLAQTYLKTRYVTILNLWCWNCLITRTNNKSFWVILAKSFARTSSCRTPYLFIHCMNLNCNRIRSDQLWYKITCSYFASWICLRHQRCFAIADCFGRPRLTLCSVRAQQYKGKLKPVNNWILHCCKGYLEENTFLHVMIITKQK